MPDCIRAGAPFRTRLGGDTNLAYPADMASLPFICEGCVVRANLDRELINCESDNHLLGLERMRNIDTARYWSKGTLTATQRHVRKLHSFAEDYSIPGFCRDPDISHPPVSPVIPIMWAVSEYTLQTSRKTKDPITYNTARALQSSASAYFAWTALLSNPDAVFKDGDGRIRGSNLFVTHRLHPRYVHQSWNAASLGHSDETINRPPASSHRFQPTIPC